VNPIPVEIRVQARHQSRAERTGSGLHRDSRLSGKVGRSAVVPELRSRRRRRWCGWRG
jgi:hypothetical protein